MSITPAAPRVNTGTSPDTKRNAVLLADPVIGLRFHGSNVDIELPEGLAEIRVGSGTPAECDVRIADRDPPTVSRLHAVLTWHIKRTPAGDERHLVLRDADSKNGSTIDDEPVVIGHVKSGSIVELGDVKLVAYSKRSKQLREHFQRYLGYSEWYQGNVERLLSATRHHRKHIALVVPRGGAGETLAALVHNAVPGDAFRLETVERRIGDRDDEQRALLERSELGTLVVPTAFLPADRGAFAARIAHYPVRLILLVPETEKIEKALGLELARAVVQVGVPALDERGTGERMRVIDEIVGEKVRALGVVPPLWPEDYAAAHERKWKRNHEEVSEVLDRLLVIRTSPTAAKAAELLKVTEGAVSHWLDAYGFPSSRDVVRRGRRG